MLVDQQLRICKRVGKVVLLLVLAQTVSVVLVIAIRSGINVNKNVGLASSIRNNIKMIPI